MIGNLGFDPEVREVAEGRKVARLSLATNDSYRNAQGERVTDTQWHTVVAWGSTADAVARILRKGSPVALEGVWYTAATKPKTVASATSLKWY